MAYPKDLQDQRLEELAPQLDPLLTYHGGEFCGRCQMILVILCLGAHTIFGGLQRAFIIIHHSLLRSPLSISMTLFGGSPGAVPSELSVGTGF